MGYSHNHYNYQVAVIFAILLGGILLLALVVGAIYFVCVNNMRGDDRKRLNSRSRPQSQVWSPPQENVTYNPPSAFAGGYTMQQPQTPVFDQHNIRSVPVSPAQQMYNVSGTPQPQQYNQPQQYSQQQYSQAPLVTPLQQDYNPPQQYRQLQPEVVYTQGPASYVAQTPVEYTVTGPTSFQTSAI